jgi:hypothetical protein
LHNDGVLVAYAQWLPGLKWYHGKSFADLWAWDARSDSGGTVDGLDAEAPAALTAGLSNPYTLDRHPELKVFKE